MVDENRMRTAGDCSWLPLQRYEIVCQEQEGHTIHKHLYTYTHMFSFRIHGPKTVEEETDNLSHLENV